MRRLALITLAAIATAVWVAGSVAGADDSHSYRIELDNAFGVVEGSEVRVAGARAGSVTDLAISPAKRAIVTVETSGPLAVLGEETTCSTEPQSLIAEYFVDCQPRGQPLREGGTIPVEQTTQTVQSDLVQNTLREPYRDRFRLLVNEFGTALAGNDENLNAAIRRGAPALQKLRDALGIVADQNTRLRDLMTDADEILTRVNERRGDVVRFVRTARDTARAAASRRAELSRDFDLLDDFLARLRPAVAELGEVSREQLPLLGDLRAAAPGLERLATAFPPFAGASRTALEGLGEAASVGRRALREGGDEIERLRRSGRNAAGAAEPLADLLRDLEDPRRAVEIDARAARACDDPTRPCWSTGRPAPTGYTTLEEILNSAYYATGAGNQYDQLSHLGRSALEEAGTAPCGKFASGYDPETGEPGVPAEGGGTTTEILETEGCVSWLGPSQPGINEDLGLPPYHPSVCPEGTEPKAAEALCFNPAAEAGFTAQPDRAVASSEAAHAPTPKGQPGGKGLGVGAGGPGLLGEFGRQPGERLGAGSAPALRELLDFLFGAEVSR